MLLDWALKNNSEVTSSAFVGVSSIASLVSEICSSLNNVLHCIGDECCQYNFRVLFRSQALTNRVGNALPLTNMCISCRALNA